MPIDFDPDTPDRARETPAAPDRRGSPDGQTEPEARHSPDAQHRREAPHPSEVQHTPEARGRREPRDQAEASEESEFRHRQIAEHVRYQHVVDAAYEAFEARQKWAEAVPKLRATWEEHKERYPEQSRPTPQTHPDGSWSCGEARRLSADQNAEVDREYARIREIGRTYIVPAMRAIEAEDPARRLAGFENRFKGEDRLKEKIADQVRSTPGITPTQALGLIPDAVRFTFQYSEDTYTAGAVRDVERFKGHGFTLVESRNTWTSDQYKGINSRWQEPKSGAIFEVQFHTQASREAKELTHKAYERIRSTAGDSELAELKAFQRNVNSVVPTPPNVTEINDYPPGET